MKKLLLLIMCIVLVVEIAGIYLYNFPNNILLCSKIVSINTASYGITYNLTDRQNDCIKTNLGGYKTMNACMYGFQEFAHSSWMQTDIKCIERSWNG